MRIWIWFVVDFSYRLVAAARGYYTQYHIISLFLVGRTLCCAFSFCWDCNHRLQLQAKPRLSSSPSSSLVQRKIEREYRSHCTMELDLWMWSKTQRNLYMKLAEWKHLSDCGRFVTILLPCSFFFSLSLFSMFFYMLFEIFHKHSIYRMACCRIGCPYDESSHFTWHPN